MNEKPHQSFTELEVWKKVRLFKNEIAEIVKRFPEEEKFRIADQLIRASRSINANIAEDTDDILLKTSCIFLSRQEDR